MKKYPTEKVLEEDFFFERLGEFYPIEDYGGWVGLCEECHHEVLNYYLNKNLDSEKEVN